MSFLPGWFSAVVWRGKRLNQASRVRVVKPKARAAISRAVVETVEGRVYLTTFDAFMGAQPGGHFGSNYIVNLYTSGGAASKWVVNWKDGTAITTSGVFGTAFAVTHTYASGSPPTAAITATATLSGSSTTATASFALYNSYGTYQFDNSGRSIFTESGDTIGADYTTVDTTTGYEYVLFSYNPGSGSHNLMAIARFSSQGVIDDSWGDAGSGGNGILYFQTSDGSNDVPQAIAIDKTDGYIMVVGQGPNGWLVEEFSNGSNGDLTFGHESFEKEGTGGGLFGSGSEATAVCFDGTHFYVGGSDTTGLDLAAARIETDGTVTWTDTATTNVQNQGVVVTSICQAVSDVYVGGTINYCVSGNPASDMTIAAFSASSGSADTSFASSGLSRQNVVGGCCSCCANATVDQLYSLVAWTDSGNTVITAVGTTQTAPACDAYTALETYKYDTGALVTGYGTGGIAQSCNPFTPSAALVYSSGGSTNQEIIVTGGPGAGNADFNTLVFGTSGAPTDGSFGTPGTSGNFEVDFGGTTTNSTDTCYSIVELSDGSILLAGTSAGNIALADCLLSVAPNIT